MSWKIIVKGAQKVSNMHKPIKFTLDGPNMILIRGLKIPQERKPMDFT